MTRSTHGTIELDFHTLDDALKVHDLFATSESHHRACERVRADRTLLIVHYSLSVFFTSDVDEIRSLHGRGCEQGPRAVRAERG